MENDTGDCVDRGGEGGHRKNVAGDFYGAFFGGALDFVQALWVRHRTDVPDVVENIARIVNENGGEFPIVSPGASNRSFVNLARGLVEEKRRGRDVSLGAIQADVSLALLLRIVKRMSVKKRPDELSTDVFDAEFEMRVLVNGVVAAVESGRADVEALLVGDFVGSDKV